MTSLLLVPGLLGLMAARLGAKTVHLYETAEVAQVAERNLKVNGARGCILHPCHSTDLLNPTKVDLVVSETLGNYPFEEDIIETLGDARARFLKPGGRLIPARLQQCIALVVADRFHRELCVWDTAGDNLAQRTDPDAGTSTMANGTGMPLDLSAAKSLSFNNVYVRAIAPADLLDGGASAEVWDTIDFTLRNRTTRQGEASWKLAKSATIHCT